MKMTNTVFPSSFHLVLAALICCCLVLFGCSAPESEEGTIPHGDEFLGCGGALGFPLGSFLIIEGRVPREDRKMANLIVDRVNGRKLPEPVEIFVVNAHLRWPDQAGLHCILRGYESGRMIGVPIDVLLAENMPIQQMGYSFFTYFIVTSVAKPEDLEFEIICEMPSS